jgi:DNA polymerase I
MKNILLLDGYNLIYRARYSGMNKGDNSTIFNFFRSIRPLVEKFSPDIVYFVLEGTPKARLEVSPDYKGQRVYNDDDGFNRQRKEIINLIKNHLPFITVRHEDYECDDIINYLANYKHKNDATTIISSDTDFIQSINDKTKLYNPVRKTFIDQTKYDYVSWKSLVGDKSDNILGFKGIGDKRAKLLLEDEEKLNSFLLQEDNKQKFEKNKFMISFHKLEDDSESITFTFNKNNLQWDLLKEKFENFEFNSIVSKEKSWVKYINTFKSLERNLGNVN